MVKCCDVKIFLFLTFHQRRFFAIFVGLRLNFLQGKYFLPLSPSSMNVSFSGFVSRLCQMGKTIAALVICFVGGAYNLGFAQMPLETLAPKASSNLASTVLYFAAPVTFSPDIAAEARIPAGELTLMVKFMGDEKTEAKYVPNQAGMRIPGYARKLDVEIFRTPLVGDKTSLWKRTFEPQQTPPDFSIKNVSVEAAFGRGKAAKLGECSFTVKNIRVDFAKPVDANGDKIITALVDDLQVADPSIDAGRTQMQFEAAGKPDAALNAALKPENITCSGFFNDGIFLVNVVVQKLPKAALKGKVLRGTLGIRLNVTLLNRRATRSATKEETVLVPIALAF
jgi:hypothetical protein